MDVTVEGGTWPSPRRRDARLAWEPGNGHHVDAFKQHADHRIAALLVGRRRHPCRRRSIRPGARPAPNPTAPLDSVPRETTPGAEPTAPAQDLRRGRPSCEIRTWSRRQGLRAALPRRSQNERRFLHLARRGRGRAWRPSTNRVEPVQRMRSDLKASCFWIGAAEGGMAPATIDCRKSEIRVSFAS
jgi:hypothetical protein